MMAGSYITEFHTHKHKEPVTTELLNKVSNALDVTCKHDVGRGHHNRSDPQSTTFADYKLVTRKDESFSSNKVKNGNVAEIMGNTFNMVEGFINNMVSESSYLGTPTAEGSNETTTESEIGELKPVVIHENNNDGIKRANTRLEPNNILEEKEE